MSRRKTIQDLIVKIAGDDKELQRSAEQSVAALGRIGRRALDVGKQVATIGVAAAVGFGELVRRNIAAQDEISKTARASGVGVRDFTALGHAAELSGASTDQLATGLQRFSRTVDEASRGTGRGADLMRRFGISVKDAEGNVRPTRDLVADFSEVFARMPEGPERTALAMDLFGRSGAQLVPMLARGRDGLRAMTDEAIELGVALDEDSAANAERFQDALTRLRAVKTGWLNQVSGHVLPMLIDLGERTVDTSKDMEGMDRAGERVAAGFRLIASVGTIVRNVVEGVGEALGSLAAAALSLAKRDFRGAWEALQQTGEDAVGRFGKIGDDFWDVWENLGKDVEARAPEVGRQLASPMTEAAEEVDREAERAARSLEQMMERLRAERAELGMSAAEVAAYRAAKLGADEATQQLAASLREEIDLARRAREVTAELATPMEQLQERQRELNALFDAGAITAETYQRGLSNIREEMKKLGEEAEEELEKVGRASINLGDSFADAMVTSTQEGIQAFRKWAQEALKQIGRVMARALIFRGIGAAFGPSSFIGSAFGVGPGRATGGPVTAGRVYPVNEREPEFFQAAASGKVVPLSKAAAAGIGGGGGVIQVSVPRAQHPMILARDRDWLKALMESNDRLKDNGYTVEVRE